MDVDRLREQLLSIACATCLVSVAMERGVAAEVWRDSFSTATIGAAPYGDYTGNGINDWSTPSTAAGAVDIVALSATENALRIVDSNSGYSYVGLTMQQMAALDTSLSDKTAMTVSFDWRLDSVTAGTPFRVQWIDAGVVRFSIGFGTDNIRGFYFWCMNGNYTAISPAAGIGWNGTAFADGSAFVSGNTGGVPIHFEVVYQDQSKTARVTMTSGAHSYSSVIAGVTPSTFGGAGDALQFTSGSSGTGVSYFSNIVVKAEGLPSTVVTSPQGVFGLSIAPGTGSRYTLTALSVPLYRFWQGEGRLTGVLTEVTSTTLSDVKANWVPGAFSTTGTPYLIKITSGAAEGRIFVISPSTANTGTALTVENQGIDLTGLGIAVGSAGDRYEIFPAQTIASLFQTPELSGIQGGASSSEADLITLYSASTGWSSYYYNITQGKWLKVGAPIDSGNVVLRPDQGIIYSRIAAAPLTLSFSGRASDTNSKVFIANSGVTFLSSIWPLNTTLASSGIQNIPGWVKAAAPAAADQVMLYTASTGWRSYYHNGSNWMRVGPAINSDSVPIVAANAIKIVRKGAASGVQTLSQELPYGVN